MLSFRIAFKARKLNEVLELMLSQTYRVRIRALLCNVQGENICSYVTSQAAASQPSKHA